MTLPLWASELLSQVCKDEGRSKKPKVKWFISEYQSESNGHYYPRQKEVFVRAGTSGDDHKQVFLHELCHWLTQPRGAGKRVFFYGEKRKKKSWHNKRFYRKLNELLTRYDCLTEEYRSREHDYMKRSVNYL